MQVLHTLALVEVQTKDESGLIHFFGAVFRFQVSPVHFAYAGHPLQKVGKGVWGEDFAGVSVLFQIHRKSQGGTQCIPVRIVVDEDYHLPVLFQLPLQVLQLFFLKWVHIVHITIPHCQSGRQ